MDFNFPRRFFTRMCTLLNNKHFQTRRLQCFTPSRLELITPTEISESWRRTYTTTIIAGSNKETSPLKGPSQPVCIAGVNSFGHHFRLYRKWRPNSNLANSKMFFKSSVTYSSLTNIHLILQ